MYSIPAHGIQFNENGNTIWIHSPLGGTILRIKTLGKIKVNGDCENICSHSDMIVKENIKICLSDDAKQITDLERIKETFELTGVNFIEVSSHPPHLPKEREDIETYLYLCSKEEKEQGILILTCDQYQAFHFSNGTLESHP